MMTKLEISRDWILPSHMQLRSSDEFGLVLRSQECHALPCVDPVLLIKAQNSLSKPNTMKPIVFYLLPDCRFKCDLFYFIRIKRVNL